MRVAVIGAECTGKTTLARALGERLGLPVVSEALRAFVEREGRVPSSAREMLALAQEQRRAEDEALHTHGGVVCDTTPLLVKVYAIHYFGRVESDFEEVVRASTYDVVLLAEDDIPWVADGMQRDGEHVRAAVQTRLRAELERLGVPYVALAGSPDERLALALAEVNRASGV